jgi:hypothetical protein
MRVDYNKGLNLPAAATSLQMRTIIAFASGLSSNGNLLFVDSPGTSRYPIFLEAKHESPHVRAQK